VCRVNVRFVVIFHVGHFKYSKYNKGTQDGYGGELGWCVVSISFIWHRYHSNDTPKQCKPRTPRTIVRKIRWVGRRTCGNHDVRGMRSWREHKLDPLESESKGAANEVPTCLVPIHAPRTSSLWRGVGDVGSMCEVQWKGTVQPRLLWKLAKGCMNWNSEARSHS